MPAASKSDSPLIALVRQDLRGTNCGLGQQTPPKVVAPVADSQLCVDGQTFAPDPLGEHSMFRSPLLSFSGSPALHSTGTKIPIK